MIMKPLTNEQIWGIPEEEMPEETQKDYFDYANQAETNDCNPPAAGPCEATD